MTDGMKGDVDEAFVKRISPEFVSRIKGEFTVDPLQEAVNRIEHMASGLDVMLEGALTLNAHSIETGLPVIKDEFLKNIGHLRGMIREGNATAAEQRLVDVVQSFASYRKVSTSLFARLTQMIESFPKYSAELNDVSAELQKVRFEIMEENVLILGEDEIKKLAVELYKILVDIKKDSSSEPVDEPDESVEEVMARKKTVVDKLEDG